MILSVVRKIKDWAYSLIKGARNSDNFNHLQSKADNPITAHTGGYHGLLLAVKNCKLAELERLLENPMVASKSADNENAIYQYALSRSKMYARFLPIVNRLQRVPEIIEKLKNSECKSSTSSQSPRVV
jgi:hypothetical protein